MSDLFLVLLLLSLAGLVVGLIRPQLLKMPSRKMAAGVFAGAVVLFFILFGVTTPQQPATVADTATTTPEVVNTSNTPAKPDTGANTGKQAQAAPAPVTTQTQKPVAPAPATTPAPTPASTPAPAPITVRVRKAEHHQCSAFSFPKKVRISSQTASKIFYC